VPNTSNLKYDFSYSTTTVGYSYDKMKSLWNGSYPDFDVNGNEATYYAFANSTKAALTNQTYFTSALTIWDQYTALKFVVDTASPELVIYHADTNNNIPTPNDGQLAAGRTYWTNLDNNSYSHAEIAIDESINVSTPYRNPATSSGGATISSGLSAIESGITSNYLYIHELLHTLGLDHPGHGAGDAPAFSAYTVDATIMHYADPQRSKIANNNTPPTCEIWLREA
jgi:Matrixin